MKVRLFIEGAKRDDSSRDLRFALKTFLRKCLPDVKLDDLEIITCGGIAESVIRFTNALQDRWDGVDNSEPVLLVDSDAYIAPDTDRAIYLKKTMTGIYKLADACDILQSCLEASQVMKLPHFRLFLERLRQLLRQ